MSTPCQRLASRIKSEANKAFRPLQSFACELRGNVSVRSDRPACVIEWVIVSTIDSGHLEVSYGGEEGSEEAGLV